MGLKSCEIFFDNQSNTYYAGQTVNGRVDYIFDGPKKVRSIRINFVGAAHTRWRKTEKRRGYSGHNERNKTKRVVYSGEEEYFNIEYYLIGGQSSKEIELPSGQTSYPFTFTLPSSLPSSFEGEYGYIRYTVKVTLDRPWKFDQVTKVAFTVISSLDLNTMPHLKNPYKVEKEKTFGCCCCRSGPLKLVVNLPCTGFVAGQKIQIVTEVDNNSNVDIGTMKYELFKNVTFHAKRPRHKTKNRKVLINKIAYGPDVNGGVSRMTKHEIEIPPLPPSNLKKCGIIDLDYGIEVEAKTSGFHLNFHVIIPITIGAIPFVSFIAPPTFNIPITPAIKENVNQSVLSESTTTNMGTIGWNATIQESGDSAYPPYPSHNEILPSEIPPPTYAESQFGTKTIQDESDNQFTCFGYNSQGYAPRYPVYGYNPSAPPSSP